MTAMTHIQIRVPARVADALEAWESRSAKVREILAAWVERGAELQVERSRGGGVPSHGSPTTRITVRVPASLASSLGEHGPPGAVARDVLERWGKRQRVAS